MALLSRLGRRLLPLAVVLTTLASLVVARPATAAPATEEPSNYIVVDADRGVVIAAKAEHAPHLTASTVKLLTALVALERLPLDTTVPVSARAASQPAMKISMLEGQVWKLGDVLRALLMESANDAAFAIAERAGGTVEQFAEEANATAKRLGAQETVFGDPAGLDDEHSYAGGSRMSAYDLAVIARNALSVPEIANTAKLMSYEFTDPAGIARQFENHNDGFLTTYAGATGLKTGFTDNAGRTLVTSATRNGRTMIAVVFGTWDDTGWSAHLLDQGFSSAADSPGTGATLPPVRAVTADQRRAAFVGLPFALGASGRNGNALSAPSAAAPTTVPTAKPEVVPATENAAAGSGDRVAATTTADDDSGSSGVSVGTFVNLRNFAIFLFLVLLTLFLLRRRAVRRQRARRIARQRKMAEIRRRRMIDLVDPPDATPGHVRVVPARSSTG